MYMILRLAFVLAIVVAGLSANATESFRAEAEWLAVNNSCPLPYDQFLTKVRGLEVHSLQYFEKMPAEKRNKMYDKKSFQNHEAFTLRLFAPFLVAANPSVNFDKQCWNTYRKMMSEKAPTAKAVRAGLEAWRGCVQLNYREATPDFFIKLTNCVK